MQPYATSTLNDIPSDRVRKWTAPEINDLIDRQTAINIRRYGEGSTGAILSRIEALENEWDIERMLELNASTLALSGLVLGMTVNKKWLAVPAVVLPFLLQHAVQGWCPPLPLLRRMGFRTQKEIDREKHELESLI